MATEYVVKKPFRYAFGGVRVVAFPEGKLEYPSTEPQEMSQFIETGIDAGWLDEEPENKPQKVSKAK